MMKCLIIFILMVSCCFSSEVTDTFKKVAKEEKIDYKTLCSISYMESGHNPKAKARKGSAKGLFGIIKSTERVIRKRYDIKGNIYNPYVNTKIGSKVIKENQRYLKKHGINVNTYTTYISHFFGAPRSLKFLKSKRNTKMCSIFRKECKYNRFMRNKTKATMESFFKNQLKKSYKRCK